MSLVRTVRPTTAREALARAQDLATELTDLVADLEAVRRNDPALAHVRYRFVDAATDCRAGIHELTVRLADEG
jgi:hypothetical protein